jgi:hypothetical protein
MIDVHQLKNWKGTLGDMYNAIGLLIKLHGENAVVEIRLEDDLVFYVREVDDE